MTVGLRVIVAVILHEKNRISVTFKTSKTVSFDFDFLAMRGKAKYGDIK